MLTNATNLLCINIIMSCLFLQIKTNSLGRHTPKKFPYICKTADWINTEAQQLNILFLWGRINQREQRFSRVFLSATAVKQSISRYIVCCIGRGCNYACNSIGLLNRLLNDDVFVSTAKV